MRFFYKFFNKNRRFLSQVVKDIEKINSLEKSISILSDDDLRAKTSYFKSKIKSGSNLDSIMHEVFATVRESAKRTLNMRHFDVQMKGGIALYKNKIAEMLTGEGKSLVVTTMSYLRALEEKGMHIITVNDYLAKRDAEYIGEVFRFLGMSVGCITSDSMPDQRKKAYLCDITYATNNELGFDYLRDNMQFSVHDKVQRPLYAACIDEADSVLIDEARTPLILSGSTDQNLDICKLVNKIILKLKEEDYIIDKETDSVAFSEVGNIHVENILKEQGVLKKDDKLYNINNVTLVHLLSQSLRANKIMKKDIDYIVKSGKVVLVQKSTGRLGYGRRFANGLHQALEAKEGVKIEQENQDLASISFQNYFLLYQHLSGMTGTASTEKEELKYIYGLDVVTIPTNKPLIRKDQDDLIYSDIKSKEKAIMDLIKKRHEIGQPFLIGTESIESSEKISRLLYKHNLPHNLLNAKNHEQEAYIIAQAGCLKKITVATNIAGRGTDIILGGNPKMLIAKYKKLNPGVKDEKLRKIEESIISECLEDRQKVIKAGGLYVLGTTRHENRRIDNQLRGRSGRQGDIGSSRFFLSLDDNLFQMFASEKMRDFLKKFAIESNEPINHPTITKIIASAQKRIEAQHYSMRKNLFAFDSVLNEQRKIIYAQRDLVLTNADVNLTIIGIIDDYIFYIVFSYINKNDISKNTISCLLKKYNEVFRTKIENDFCEKNALNDTKKIYKFLFDYAKNKLNTSLNDKYQDSMAQYLFLSTIDEYWRVHMESLKDIREGIHNRAYAQQDPLQEYKKEALSLFEQMLDRCTESFLYKLFSLSDYVVENNFSSMATLNSKNIEEENYDIIHEEKKYKRNDPCHCNSGKKYKNCHGRI